MKTRTLLFLCIFPIVVWGNDNVLKSDEEIRKYEIRGVMDVEIPSISIYYQGESLGWLKPGQKKGNCLLKAYDKTTKEVILEINGKEYRLREGASTQSKSESEENQQLHTFTSKDPIEKTSEYKKEIIEINNKRVLKLHSDNPDEIFNIKAIVNGLGEDEKFEEIHLYGSAKVYLGDSERINASQIIEMKKGSSAGMGMGGTGKETRNFTIKLGQ